MGNCTVNFSVNFADGSPAPFAHIDVFIKNCFWIFCWENYVGSATCNVYGRVSFSLNKGSTYHFRCVAWNAAGQRKQRDNYFTISWCPYNCGSSLPP